eukprot:CAMPEP_0201551600 /NCGR_PEP_ID=MMETSP0173_2-20130828/7744_1 /ASSEMBLY_ACC=CAM_ASM_000268 /TAXON_ID=218659 /ORGANISM="Vexillifera sp., Strain DIVA3 564/2" /LENGTH=149 /DNA_ID=CAMNT_0047961895 /DNA_START=254 /DNA_END=703 /DNA_ORIENTATION=+
MPETKPTKTFVETFATHKKHEITMKEISSKEALRNLWKHEVEQTNIWVWFVDSTNKDLMAESGKALQNFVKHNQLQDMPWLILVTKTDKDGAMSSKDVLHELDIEGKLNIGTVLSISSATGQGVEAAVDWIVKAAQTTKYRKGEAVTAI